MRFTKNSTKLYNLSSIIVLFIILSKVYSLIEFPITKINLSNIPKYPDFKPDTEIPEYIIQKIRKKNPNFFKKLVLKKNNKLNSSSGEIKIITNLLFVINVKLGSSKQIFNLLIDTGSSITWVPKINSADLYPLLHHYDPSLSSTSIKKKEDPFEIVYGSGSVKGSFYSDKMSYLDDKEFIMDFGAAEKTNFDVNGSDGILGLSRIYDDYDKSFIHMMCKYHITDSKIFSVKFGLNSTENSKGIFYIGKHDDFNKDSVVGCELNNRDYYDINYWACDVLSFSIINRVDNIEMTSKKKISVIFDTGTNAIFLPSYYLQDMVTPLENSNCFLKNYKLPSQPDRHQIICTDYIPDFKLNIGGHTFILPGKYFFSVKYGVAFSDIYFQDSYSNGEDDVFIIGSPFFMLFHVLFNSYTKELFFYPEIEGTIIKGSWWNTKHIVIVVILILIIIFTFGLGVYHLIWRKKYKSDYEQKLDEKFEVRTMFGML